MSCAFHHIKPEREYCAHCESDAAERDVVTLYHRHSIEEIMAMTGLSKALIQGAVLRAIRAGRVKPYASSEG